MRHRVVPGRAAELMEGREAGRAGSRGGQEVHHGELAVDEGQLLLKRAGQREGDRVVVRQVGHGSVAPGRVLGGA